MDSYGNGPLEPRARRSGSTANVGVQRKEVRLKQKGAKPEMQQFSGEFSIGVWSGSIAKGDKGCRSRAAISWGKRGTILIDGDTDTGPNLRTRLFHPGCAGGWALGSAERERASIGDERTDGGNFIVIV